MLIKKKKNVEDSIFNGLLKRPVGEEKQKSTIFRSQYSLFSAGIMFVGRFFLFQICDFLIGNSLEAYLQGKRRQMALAPPPTHTHKHSKI
jgi:hypothetical protein